MSCICENCPPPCCSTPFIQTNVSNGNKHCISCKKNYKIVITYECPSCHEESSSLSCLDLEDEDGNTDWCVCDLCNYEYRQPNLIVHKRINYSD